MFIKTYLLLGGLVVSLRTIQMAPVQSEEGLCSSDFECPQNFYCYMESHLCAPCKEDFCDKLNRHKTHLVCSKDYTNCGQCISGFKEEILADGKARDACIMEPQMDSEELDLSSPVLLGICGILLSVVVFLLYVHFKKPTTVSQPGEESVPLRRSQTSLHKSTSFPCFSSLTHPPAFNPTAPVLENEDNKKENIKIENKFTIITESPLQKEVSSVQQTPQQTIQVHLEQEDPNVRRKEQEKFVAANLFRHPDAVTESNSSIQTEEQEDTNDQVIVSEAFTYHDESTQPSLWTPDVMNSGDEAAGRSQENKRPYDEDDDVEKEIENKIKKVCEEH